MLASIDDREGAVVREVLSMLDDPGDIEDITRLLQQSQQLSAREQQLKADLRELGVIG
ncbi:hypothetical protein TSOC_002119 [Tetrabaena socialis]|uniref:Uncharacterized protein n=1 Tax=Tetrabaena socialis TaxID=47790 RepID=A0A2J8AEX2_9CHLO|nr:hypothetical protein TSOC_002119 [Tetrabaena socialis]|eukprot:PNH11067.1 hypothetical protein TSOC_002119 [Tetrabaena socialis]